MDNNFNQQFDFKKALTDSAKSYFALLDNLIVLKSDGFVENKIYKIRFFDTNFLHLTGLKTKLSPKEFFDKCLSETISEDDYSFGLKNDKKTIKRKLRNLINIGSFFKQEIMVQESFIKNKVVCQIATSDNKCTIGFVDAKYYLRPKTILANNHLDKDRPIYLIVPEIIKSH